MEGRCEEEREWKLNRILEGSGEKVKGIRERRGDKREIVMTAEFCDEGNAKGIMENKGKIRMCWGVRVDEDLTMREKRRRWRMVEKARREIERGSE